MEMPHYSPAPLGLPAFAGVEQRLYLQDGIWIVEDAVGRYEFGRHDDARAFRDQMDRLLKANRLRVVQGGRS
jgi:hypothetical protein